MSQKMIGLNSKVQKQLERIKKRFERKFGIEISYSDAVEKIIKSADMWKEE